MKKLLTLISGYLFLFVSINTIAQTTDSTYTADTATTKGVQGCTAIIHEIHVDQLKTNHFHISEVLTSLQGVNQMSTGVAISKPVIRGLYGNRIQTQLFGLRFDNQQWGYSHGLGLSGFGVSQMEVIFGPSALMHGSETMGGVIRIAEEKKEEKGKISGDINTSFASNTMGNKTDIGFKGNTGKRNWGIRAGYESHADYADGENKRVLNSRFNGYYFKANFGFQKNKWESQNNFYSSLNNFGLILVTDSVFKKKPDERFSRTMDGAHQAIFCNVLSSQNSLQLKNSVLKLNIGGISNIHKEYMGYGWMRYNMHLISAVYNLQWIKSLSKKTKLIVGNQGLFQSNVNRGIHIVIPDARTVENGLSATLNYRLEQIYIEGGISGNYRFIKTLFNPYFNTIGTGVRPFEKSFPSINGMLAITFHLFKFELQLKSSTGFRSPNLAELSYVGIQAGAFHFEDGNINLKSEQNFNTELKLKYDRNQVYFYINVFDNYFRNYIYTAPTSKTYGGDPVYSYFQSPANLYGGEVLFGYRPNFIKYLSFQSSFSKVTGLLDNKTPLPLIPANKLHTELFYFFYRNLPFFNSTTILISNDYVFRQDQTAALEIPTDSYMLFNVGIGSTLSVRKQSILISITCNNIFNHYYSDHLSMIKNWGYRNIGRNITLSVQIPFNLKK